MKRNEIERKMWRAERNRDNAKNDADCIYWHEIFICMKLQLKYLFR